MISCSSFTTTFSKNVGLTMEQASIMSAWTGLVEFMLALRTLGLEPLPMPGFRARLWFFMMVSRPAMPGRMLLRPPP